MSCANENRCQRSLYRLYKKKWYKRGKNNLCMKSSQTMCVCGTKLKPKDVSCWYILFCIICFVKTKIMLIFVRRGENRNYTNPLFGALSSWPINVRNLHKAIVIDTACAKWIFLDCRKLTLIISQDLKLQHQKKWKQLQRKVCFSCFMELEIPNTLHRSTIKKCFSLVVPFYLIQTVVKFQDGLTAW